MNVRRIKIFLALVICCFTLAEVLSCEFFGGDSLLSAAPHASPREIGEPCSYKITTTHLPNAVQVHEKVISGGLPADDKAFAELAELGVKTIISVDGQRPDAESAKKFGMRYVHLPHGYNGIPSERVKELAKAVHDLPGPIYIHCHHGKHRSPAAASVACVAAGMIPENEAVNVLKVAGTSPHYRGLFQAADIIEKIDTAKLDALKVTFQEQMAIPPLVETMVAIEHSFGHLKQFQSTNWIELPEHPDLDATHEALLLKEHFRELFRYQGNMQEADYRQMLQDSEIAASQLEAKLRKWNGSQIKGFPLKELNQHMSLLSDNCKKCHQKYRDLPLDSSALK